MFTGIVEEVGSVREIRSGGARARLVIEADRLAAEVAVGDSVAVEGACLTVTAIDGSLLGFDVVTETLLKTTLRDLHGGSPVNLEGALRVGDRLSGHFVMGHVDGVGQVVGRSDDPGQMSIRIRAPESVEPYLLEKGSIAVSGVSLTLWDVEGGRFSVALVPHTLAETTLRHRAPGDRVNLEADVLARWVARMVRPAEEGGPPGGLTVEKLRDAGWEV